MSQPQYHPMEVFNKMGWVDGRPLRELIEPYRAALFEKAYQYDGDVDRLVPGTCSRVKHNLILSGRAKKNWKTGDGVLWCIYKLLFWRSWSGNQIYTIANDEDQAGDDLELGKKLIAINRGLADRLKVTSNIIERKDGLGFWEILPAGDVKGSHGKTYLLCMFDEIHGYKNWDILEAMQLDPSRADAQLWLTSYASMHHKPGVPLFDLMKIGREGKDPRMVFNWYASDFTTDPSFADVTPEQRANPSMGTWTDANYLEQQKTRLPFHRYRRLHLNLPGLPEGSAFTYEKIDAAIERGVKVRPLQESVKYVGFVDMSGGSNDDACLGIAHQDPAGKTILDVVINQGPPPAFDPMKAVSAFAKVLKQYRVFTVVGDAYAGETFRAAFEKEGIGYLVSELNKSELYEAMEVLLNTGRVILLDQEVMESQFLGLVWKGGKIDHQSGSGEHDDWSNTASGALWLASQGGADLSAFLEANKLAPQRSFNVQRGSWLEQDSADDGQHPMDVLLDHTHREGWDL